MPFPMFRYVTNATVFTIVEQSFQTHHANYYHKYIVATPINAKCRCFTRLSNDFSTRTEDGGVLCDEVGHLIPFFTTNKSNQISNPYTTIDLRRLFA